MKKKLVGALILCMVLSGCSSTSTSSTNDGSSVNGTEGSSKTNSAEKITLSFTWWGSQSRHDYTEKLLEKYTELHPNITFESAPLGWDGFSEKIAAEAAGGVLPDIIQMPYTEIANYSKNDLLADLQGYIDNGVIDATKVDPALLSTGKIDDKMTGFVIASGALAFSYNPDVFKEANVDVPTPEWTWDDFMNAMKTVKNKTGKYGVGKFEAYNYFPYWCRQNGQRFYAEDGSKLGYEDDKLLVDFIEMFYSLQKEGAMPTPDEWAQIVTKGKEAEPVVTGEAAGTFDWNNFNVIVSGTNPNLELVTPPSNGTKALFINPGMFLSVSEKSEHKEEAAAFIDWIVNSKEANDIIKAERGVPVSSEIRDYLKPNLDAQSEKMFDYIDLAIQESSKDDGPSPAGSAEVVDVLNDKINQVLYDQMSAEEAAKQFRTEANEILARASQK